uniref:Peptidase S1 domain-containing protein n=1 Tax=Glossina brevipalpis TaxID=37001 RepID=A0A1A9WGZ8_9MUSC
MDKTLKTIFGVFQKNALILLLRSIFTLMRSYLRKLICFFVFILLVDKSKFSLQHVCTKDPIEIEKDTELSKYMVWYIWPNDDENLNIAIGIIISEEIILTYNYQKMTLNKMGYIVYNERKYSPNITSEKIIHWINGVNYQNIVGDSSEIHIGLVKLNSEIELTTDRSEIVSLPKKSFAGTSNCVVIGPGGVRIEEIVETPVKILTRDNCLKLLPNLHENLICIDYEKNKNIYTCDTGQCEHFQNGAALFCNGILTGIVNELKPCISSLPRPCTKIYPYIKWIKSEMNKLRKVILYSKYAKYLVYYGWYVDDVPVISGLASILDKNILLTHFAPNLDNASIIVRNSNNQIIRNGFAIYGLRKYIKTPQADRAVNWRNVKNFLNVDNPDPLQIQIALIKVNEAMILKSGKAAIIKLPKKEPKSESRCIAVHITKIENEPIIETNVTIVERNLCLKQLPGLHAHALCFYVTNSNDEINHCTLFLTGAPIICNNQFTCIVSYSDECFPDLPRPCTSVHKFYEWIKMGNTGILSEAIFNGCLVSMIFNWDILSEKYPRISSEYEMMI